MNNDVIRFIQAVNESLDCEWIGKIFQNAIIENDTDFMKKFIHHYNVFVKNYID